ncbi:hypothetical protein MKX47_12360 [Solibacillus sp. FSL R7-0668]|uniref:hypothetical protein n=1 Tax=Solibacillus sp. FSL R7-0668 TaxID=2921688 RepID=UPI0030F55229
MGLSFARHTIFLLPTIGARKKIKKEGNAKMVRKNRKPKNRNAKLMTAANMPPLYHTLPSEEFNRGKSEVLKWLAERPALIEYVYDQAKNKGEIIYDATTGKWQGVYWEDDDE